MTQMTPTKTDKECVDLLSSQEDQHVAALVFEKQDYPLFSSEYTLKGENIIFHFFPKELPTKQAWLNTFPERLSRVAQEYWNATYPRLEALYTEELASWCLIANGFAGRFDPHGRSIKFLNILSKDFQDIMGFSPNGSNSEISPAGG